MSPHTDKFEGLEVTEDYLKGNFQNYLKNCESANEAPLLYAEWRKWFVVTFGVTVVTALKT